MKTIEYKNAPSMMENPLGGSSNDDYDDYKSPGKLNGTSSLSVRPSFGDGDKAEGKAPRGGGGGRGIGRGGRGYSNAALFPLPSPHPLRKV